MRTPIRYALWSLVLVVPMMLCLCLAFSMALDGQASPPADVGHFTAALAAVALGLTAIVAPASVWPEKKEFPAWTWALIGAAFVQLLVVFFACAGSDHASAGTTAFLPAALVAVDLTAVVFLQVWSGSLTIGLSPYLGFPIGLAFCAWIFRLGRTASMDEFLAVSGGAVAAVLTAGCAIALRPDGAKKEDAAA